MEEFTDNSILKILQNIFKDYCASGEDYITKITLFKFFYDFKLMDTCGYNIFEINNFLNQLNPNEDRISLRNFFILIFYIYKMQMKSLQENNPNINNNENNKSEEESVSNFNTNEVNKIVEDRLQIYTKNNIIKLILEKNDRIASPYKYLSPDFSNDDIKYICSYELLNFISEYMHSIENDIFNKYATTLENKNGENNNNNNNKEGENKKNSYKFINIVEMNTLIFDYPIFKNFNCETIAKYMELFINDIPSNYFDTFKIIFDEKLEGEKIKEIFNEILIDTDELNFTYSSLVIILVQFALKLQSSQGKTYQEAIQFLFESEFNLKTDSANLTEQVQEEKEEEPDYDYIPDSEKLNDVKKGKSLEDAEEFFAEILDILDKELPPTDNNILAFANDHPLHSNTITTNQYKIVPAKFPLETLQVEIDEKKEQDLAAYESKRIAKALKKKKRNARDPPPKEIHMDELPKEEVRDERYLGKHLIETLTNRLIKKTYKEIIANTNVYPSLIRETLILPNLLPSKIKEMIIECYKDQIKGHLEIAIRRLERADDLLHDLHNEENPQIDLFFHLTFGSLYEDLDFDVQAIKYYFNAKRVSDKLFDFDPDKALIYSYLGQIFLKINELEWSLRCYQKAKEIREKIIGGDTLDTAAIYNNLGVVSFYMESFLPAKSYFNLAYEITRSILGIMNPRTIQIKSNISKLNHLNFNKTVNFKTLGKYQTPTQLVKNPKRKKK